MILPQVKGDMIYIKNKERSLLGVLALLVMLVQAQIFLSRPKLIPDRTWGLFAPFPEGSFVSEESSTRIGGRVGYFYPEASGKNNSLGPVDLELELLGTVVGSGKDPLAFIKDTRAGKQGIYRLGAMVSAARVIKISVGEVILDIGGRQEILRLGRRGLSLTKPDEDMEAIISISSDRVTLSRRGLLNQAADILNLVPALKFRPYYEADKVCGLMIEGVSGDSLIAAAGIRNRDVLRTVNDQRIDSYQKALQVLSKVRNKSEISVDLLRDGKVKNLSYHISG